MGRLHPQIANAHVGGCQIWFQFQDAPELFVGPLLVPLAIQKLAVGENRLLASGFEAHGYRQ